MIEPAEMGLHGTFGNLHTYLLFRAVQLQSVSGGVGGPAAPKSLSFPVPCSATEMLAWNGC